MVELWLSIDQYGTKTLLESIKYKYLRDRFHAGGVRKMYRDSTEGPRHVGFVLGQGHGNTPLWIYVYQMIPLHETKKEK